MPTPNLGLLPVVSAMSQPELVVNQNSDLLDALVTKKSGDVMTGPLGISVTSGPGETITITDSGGGSDVPALRPTFLELYHITSATTVAGVGHGINFTTQNASAGKVSIGRVMYEITTPTAGSVESTGGVSAFSNNTEVEVFRWIGSAASAGARPATSDANGAMMTGVPGFVGGKLLLRGTFHTTWTTRMFRDAATSGTVDPTLWITAPADTGLTASTEMNAVLFDLSATRTWATGNITTQRAVVINAPTYAFAGASTITNAATLHVFGAPVPGANATLTNSASLWVQGPVCFGNNVQGTSKAGFSFAQGQNTAQPTAWYLAPVASATMPASTEANIINMALNRIVTFATGALTTQREILIQAPTYAFVGASTITNAATLAIAGAPTAGSNATLTNPMAFWVQAGTTRFDGAVQVQGLTTAERTVTGNTTLTATDHTLFADATSGAIVVTLPLAASMPGQELTIKKTDVSANTVTVTRAGSDTVEGATTFVISGALAVVRLKSAGGTVWWNV